MECLGDEDLNVWENDFNNEIILIWRKKMGKKKNKLGKKRKIGKTRFNKKNFQFYSKTSDLWFQKKFHSNLVLFSDLKPKFTSILKQFCLIFKTILLHFSSPPEKNHRSSAMSLQIHRFLLVKYSCYFSHLVGA